MDARSKQIISDVEQNYVFDATQYDYLLNHIEKRGIKNAFYYLMYCVDWQYMYGYNGRLTMLDIIITCQHEEFINAYDTFRSFIINGDTNDICVKYNKLKSCIKKGLRNHGISDTGSSDRKGLGEFIYNFFMKAASVDYEVYDYTKPYITGVYLSNRIVSDFFGKFMYAYQLMYDFQSQLVSQHIGQFDVEYDKYFIPHILLRHYPHIKIYYRNHSNPMYKRVIKNGLGQDVHILAFKTAKGITPISNDGMFESDFIHRCVSEEKITIIRDEVNEIVSLLNNLLSTFAMRFNVNSSPAIVYYENQLYGIEYETTNADSNVLRVGSFYPLNSTWQKIFGISRTDYRRIINKDDMQRATYNVRIEKPYVTKCRLVFWTIQYYINKLIHKR